MWFIPPYCRDDRRQNGAFGHGTSDNRGLALHLDGLDVSGLRCADLRFIWSEVSAQSWLLCSCNSCGFRKSPRFMEAKRPPPLNPIVCQMKPVHTLPRYLFKIYFKISLPSSEISPPFKFPCKNSVFIYNIRTLLNQTYSLSVCLNVADVCFLLQWIDVL